ncbi:MAG: phospholipase A [Burkholderiales bacterium]
MLKTSARAVLRVASGAVLLLAANAATADTDCPALEDDVLRLACYDRANGRRAPALPLTSAPAVIGPAPDAPQDEAVGTTSRLSAAWELDPADKRGIFKLLPHKLNYLLPVVFTSNTNALPSSPAAGHSVSTARSVDKLEAKYQLSLKIKALENLFGNNGDLWLAYTQQSYWQVYDGKQSSPFRTTDYEPEAFLSLRTGVDLLGWRWRMLNLGIVHQSNGNGLPLSRSWNRAYAQFGFERGDWSLLVRPWWRLPESAMDDDNPDIRRFMGSGDARLTYARDGHVLSALGRHAGSGRGFLQLDWAWPIANALKGYVQITSGYGASLIDYNHAQTTLGAGIVVFPWK